MQVQAQRVPAEQAACADQRGGEGTLQGAVGSHAPGRGEPLTRIAVRGGGRPVQLEQPRPPAEPSREQPAQRLGVGVGWRYEAVGLDPGELQHAPACVERSAGLLAVESDELRRAAAARAYERPAREGAAAQLLVLESVLGDRIARPAALRQPAGHLGGTLAERMQVASRDHQQRDPAHPVIVQPVPDQGTALERGRLYVVQGDGDLSVRSGGRAPRPDAGR